MRVTVPATSANLGPGFDAAGLALSLYDEVEAEVAGAGVAVTVEGEGAGRLPEGERHLVARAMRAVFDRLGAAPAGWRLRCTNRIPQSRGLGSSSAAICAGLLVARALVPDGPQRLDDAAVLALADELEGHPDNVAACLRGGLTLAWGRPPRVLRLSAHPRLRALAFVPPGRSSTRRTRGLLPPTVPFGDAAANAARAALLAHAVTAAPEFLLDATEDRLHQPYRAPAMPATAALVAALRGRGVPAAVSGAGPTVLALGTDLPDLRSACPAGWRLLDLAVDAGGAQVVAG